MKNLKMRVAFLLLFVIAPLSFAQSAEVTGLQKSTLSNGMELFVLENHVVPLARIQITFRCGAISQTPETVGLFHLYEHMLFKGNRVFKTQSDFQAAMKELGVASWNGGTSGESVSYYFTVPSDKVAKGIEFWGEAVRYPLFNPDELTTEKDVVMSEVQGYLNDPNDIYQSGIDKALFWKYPWRKDVGGYEKIIRGATVQTMRDIQSAFYIPNNSALFVGGDVDPKAVRAAVDKYFGDWKRGKDPWAKPLPAQAALAGGSLVAFSDDQMYNGVAFVEIRLRGPEVLADTSATYAADVWGKLIDDPNGKFKADIFSKVPGLYKKEYISAYYATQRDGGFIDFSTYMILAPGEDTFARLAALKKAFTEEMAAMASDPAYFNQKDFEVMRTKLADERVLERETVDGFIGSLSFWWATANTDYYLGYADNLKKVGFPQLRKYLTDYLAGKNSVLSVRMNPQDFSAEKASAEKANYTILTKDNAYWWAGK
jgi:zinc protease